MLGVLHLPWIKVKKLYKVCTLTHLSKCKHLTSLDYV